MTNSQKKTQSTKSSKTLVIVESPNKVKTIEKILGDRYVVRATVGHIGDIPEKSGAVDVANDFAAPYVLSERGEAVIAQLKVDLHFCDELVLATDDDREGELIAALVVEFLQSRVPVRRAVFHSVTKESVMAALGSPREVNMALVEAAKARRVLDRLVGYEVSGVVRKKVRGDLTAGRVQSAALRMVVERELECIAFVSSVYRGVEVGVGTEPGFTARLVSMGGQRLAVGKDFSATGELVGDGVVPGVPALDGVVAGLVSGSVRLVVAGVAQRKATRSPLAPFTMSSLFQEAGNRLGMSTAEARVVSQQLFDKGLITYPRTDVAVHEPASRRAIRDEVARRFGDALVSPSERFVSAKGKAVQGAHEAIRPTDLSVSDVSASVTAREAAMYAMVWQRTIASQMIDATGSTTTLRLMAGECEFVASGTLYNELGYRRVWASRSGSDAALPAVGEGEVLPVASAAVTEHTTQPPARFTEASLVAEMEERGIGRPSTYAATIAKLRERSVFVRRGERALIPRVTALAVHRLLTLGFADLVDYGFTADMESRLDAIASGEATRTEVLSEFWFGVGGSRGLESTVAAALEEIEARETVCLRVGAHPVTGDEIVVRPGKLFKGVGRPYVSCGERNLSIPDETPLADLGVERVVRLLDVSWPRELGVHPVSGDAVTVAFGRYGGYVRCGEETRTLRSDADLFDIGLDGALELLAEPKGEKRGRSGGGKGGRRGSSRRTPRT